jgi:CRISPR/Cas system-associated protein Csm6
MTAPEEQAALDLSQVLNKDILNPIFADTIIRSALFPFVSQAAERTSEEIDELVASDQFKQRLQLLNTAINQGAFASIIDSLDTENSKLRNSVMAQILILC